MSRFVMFVLFLVLLSACAPAATPVPDEPKPAPADNSYGVQPGDDALTRGPFFLDEKGSSILTMESSPPQFMLNLKGQLPTPCHKMRAVVNQPDASNKIVIEAYSVMAPDEMCAEMIQEFDGNIPLGSFAKGHYTVWVNETKIGEIDA